MAYFPSLFVLSASIKNFLIHLSTQLVNTKMFWRFVEGFYLSLAYKFENPEWVFSFRNSGHLSSNIRSLTNNLLSTQPSEMQLNIVLNTLRFDAGLSKLTNIPSPVQALKNSDGFKKNFASLKRIAKTRTKPDMMEFIKLAMHFCAYLVKEEYSFSISFADWMIKLWNHFFMPSGMWSQPKVSYMIK